MIYLRTEDHEGFRSLKRGRGAIQWAGGGGAVGRGRRSCGEGEGGAEEGARGGKRRRRIMCNECVPPSELL